MRTSKSANLPARVAAPIPFRAPQHGVGLRALHEPVFAGNEWRYLRACLDGGWVSSAGPLVQRFENAFADYVGARHAVATVNGTAALHVALCVAGIQAGDEVLVPDLTFVASVHAVRYCGAHPVLMDAAPATWQIDAGKVADFLARQCERRDGLTINKHTGRPVRAIVPVHLLGLACEIDRLMAIAKRYRLAVVEDAAQAVGVRYGGRHVGTFGDLGAFSFNGNKIITTGGGGMVVTNNRQLAVRARRLTTLTAADTRQKIREPVGFNYRMNNLEAAMGLAQLEQLDTFITRQRRIAKTYGRALNIEGLIPMTAPPGTEPTFWLYTIRLGPRSTLADRNRFLRRLAARGIGARPLWRPMHGLPVNRDCYAHQTEHAQRLYEQSVCLPSGTGLSDRDLQRCIVAVIDASRVQRHGRSTRR